MRGKRKYDVTGVAILLSSSVMKLSKNKNVFNQKNYSATNNNKKSTNGDT